MNFNFIYNRLEFYTNKKLDINNRNPQELIVLDEFFERKGAPKKYKFLLIIVYQIKHKIQIMKVRGFYMKQYIVK